MHSKRNINWIAAAFVLALPTAALAQNFSLGWYKVSGGGEMFTTGGNFELSGTIGQHDAATVAMTGGSFELTGGFWAGVVADPCAEFVCGDTSCDGMFNGADIDPFFEALGDPVAWQANHPGCELLCVADINYDGAVNGADIDAFFEALGGGACP